MAVRRCLWKQSGSTTADHVVRGSATPVPVSGCPCQNEAGVAVLSGCARPATSKEHQLMLTARVSLHSSACTFLKQKIIIVTPHFYRKKLLIHDFMCPICFLVCEAEPRGLIARRVTEVAQSTLDMVSTAVDYPLCECLHTRSLR